MSEQSIERHKARWFARYYGTRRGYVKTLWYQLLHKLGRYSEFQRVDWSAVERLVFVCKGNICRSAYAEAVASLAGVNAISCGLDTIMDAPADNNAILCASRRGADLGQHRTTPFMYISLKKTDLLVAMEPWHIDFLINNLTRRYQYTLLGLWKKPAYPHIQDPFGTVDEYFDCCFKLIEDSVHEIVREIKKSQSAYY